jgi:hypothetical protein
MYTIPVLRLMVKTYDCKNDKTLKQGIFSILSTQGRNSHLTQSYTDKYCKSVHLESLCTNIASAFISKLSPTKYRIHHLRYISPQFLYLYIFSIRFISYCSCYFNVLHHWKEECVVFLLKPNLHRETFFTM